MGKMKERTIELSDLAIGLTNICAVSHNICTKSAHAVTENGEQFGWINRIQNSDLKYCYVSFVIDINWETEMITYYASMPSYRDKLSYTVDNIFDMYDNPRRYMILSIDTRAHKCKLFESEYHDEWMFNMFKWMAEYYMHMHGEETPKANESKTNEEETIMSELKIKKPVIFNAPATVVYWSDKSKQVLKCREQDEWDEEKALALAIAYKLYGKKEFNELLKNARHITDDSKAKITVLNTTETNDEVCENGCTCSCGSCSCDETPVESNISGPTNEDIMQAIDLLLLRFVEIRQEVDDLKSKKKRKSKKNEE